MDAALSFSVASVVEDVLQRHGNRSRALDLDARRAQDAALRRYEAAEWLRKVVGVVGAKNDLPAEPSEEEFRLGLRSGIMLCTALNKFHPGAVPKVVESPCDPALIPDGAPLSAYQYFENVRNFLVAVQHLGMPTFEASDLEQGGKSSRIVNCVLALKSYSDWKQTGGNGVWKFGGNVKTTASGKLISRKNSEPFTNSLSRNMPPTDNSLGVAATQTESSRLPNSSLSSLVQAILLDKKPEDVPNLIESVLSKVVEEFEHRCANQMELRKANPKDCSISYGNKCSLKTTSANVKKRDVSLEKEDTIPVSIQEKESERRIAQQRVISDKQKKNIKELKQSLSTAKAGLEFMQMKFNEEIHRLGHHFHGLSHAASNYHRVLEENRKLYNQVQDLKGSIRVYCRVRPFLPGQFNSLSSVECIEEGAITVNAFTKNGKGRKSFNFNKVFGPSITQEEVFSDTRQLIRSVLDGYNVCIFAYGQTGSGKTYTMSGPKDFTEHSQGVNYRALSDLFHLAELRKDTFYYDISVQMIEIYNEQVRDLLVSEGLSKRLEIRNSSQNGISVPDASLVRVSSTIDVINLMNIGQKNRVVGATALNDRSSRSHSCFTVHVHGKDAISGTILRGCMHLVDLAGSERVDKSEVTGDRLKEAQHINKSLSALGDVISSLAQKNAHVPYRNSKLTQLLQDSLGGQAKTLMFVQISPEPDAIGETISTLKFAERVATVELGAARVNKDSSDVKDLKDQIANLKSALGKKEEEPVSSQQKVSGTAYAMQSSSFNPNSTSMQWLNNPRRPMEEVGNIEFRGNSVPRTKNQSLDLDELLGNSPPWLPPVSSGTYQNNGEEDREFSSCGEWVDKLMVNRQDPSNGVQNPVQCWDSGSTNINMHNVLLCNSKYNNAGKQYDYLYSSKNQFDGNVNSEDLEEADAATSDSSEPDLLWQFNHSKLGSLNSNLTDSKVQKPKKKPIRSPEFRVTMAKTGPSPSGKTANCVGQQGLVPQQRNNARRTPETQRKSGNRK